MADCPNNSCLDEEDWNEGPCGYNPRDLIAVADCLRDTILRLQPVANAAEVFRHAEIHAGAIRLGIRAGNQEDADDKAIDALTSLRTCIDSYRRERQKAAEAAREEADHG